MPLIDDAQELETNDQLRRDNRRLAAELRRIRTSKDELIAAVTEGARAAFATIDLPPVSPPAKDTRRKGDEIAVLVWSDWQTGKVTPTYDSQIARERVAEYCRRADRIVELQRANHPVKRCVIFVVGDILEGELIFPGQAHHIDSGLFDQLVTSSEMLAEAVRWAASRFEDVSVFAVPGNHGYLGGRSRKEMHPKSNADRMTYDRAQLLTSTLPNVTWSISDEWWTVADLGDGCRFLLLHGDNVRGYNGIPWYGWTRKVLAWASLSKLWPDMVFDHVVAGHFHTPVSLYINGRRLWINASTESHNPYALEQLAAAGEPAQWLLFAKPGQGVTGEYLVSCLP